MHQEKITFCRLCEPMCGLKVEVEDGRVLRIRGDQDHPLSRGWICRRGVAFAEVHNDPDRLRHPVRKTSRGFEKIPWDTAIEEVAGKLNDIHDRFGPDAVSVYMGNPLAFCTYGAVGVSAFVRALGTSQFYTSGSQDCNNKFAASERVFGSPILQPLPDLDHIRYLVMIGANPVVSGMTFAQVPRPAETLRNIQRRGGELVVVDPRRTETAKLASEHLFIQPDTDCFFLLSLLWVLVERNLIDRHWAEEDPKGFEALSEVVRQWPPERTEPITGISRDKVIEIALRLSGPEPAACYGSLGINLGRSGTLTYWLLLVLNLLSGHFDRKGGSFFCRGVMDMNRIYRYSGVGRSRKRSLTGDFLPVMDTYPAALLAHEILNERKPRVRALVVVAGNPLLSVPNEQHLKEALQKLDLLVCLDLYRNETGAFAHYLLPTTDFLEREDLNLSHAALQLHRYAAYTPAVIEPDGDQREEWDILESLCKRMGLSLWGRSTEMILKAVQHFRRPKQQLTSWVQRFSILKKRSTEADDFRKDPDVTSLSLSQDPTAAWREGTEEPIVTPRLMVRLLLRLLGEKDLSSIQSSHRGLLLEPHSFGCYRMRKRWYRRRTRVRLAPQDLVREALKLEGFLALRGAEKGEFLLIGKRERHTHNTWLHNAEGLMREETTNYLYLNPEDAAEKGIEEGDRVRVLNSEGQQIEVPCRLTLDMKKGVIALPHGWGHHASAGWCKAAKRPGVNVNRLVSDSVWKLEPLAGMAWMTGIPVDVQKVKRKGRQEPTKRGSGTTESSDPAA